MRAATLGMLKKDEKWQDNRTPTWLYEVLRGLIDGQKQSQRGLAAIVRGEAPDGTGNPLLDLSQFFYKPGLPGNQIAFGGTGPGGFLVLSSTRNSTKGKIYLGSALTSAYDEANDRLGIGTASPTAKLHLVTALSTQYVRPVSDVTVNSGWSASGAATLAAAMNEVSPSDAEFARFLDNVGLGINYDGTMTNGIVNPGTFTAQLKVRIRTTVPDGTNHKIRIHLAKASGGDFFGPRAYGTSASSPDQVISSTPTTYTYDFTAGDIANMIAVGAFASQPWHLGMDASGAVSTGNATDISWIEFSLSGAGVDILQKWTVGTNTDSFTADGTNLSLTGPLPIFLSVGSTAASGIRFTSDATSQSIEVGSSSGTNKTLFFSGISATQLTSARIAGQLVISNTTPASVPAPTGILDVINASGTTTINCYLKALAGQTGRLLKLADSTGAELGGFTGAGAVFLIAGAGNGKILQSDANGVGSWVAPSALASSAALTKTDDTNVTLTLGGSPNTALLAATSLTLGWTGQLSLARGGTGIDLNALSAQVVYRGDGSGSGTYRKVTLTAQTADIATTNLTSSPASGDYLVTVYLQCTTADVGAGTLTVTIGWTDTIGAMTDASVTLTLTATGRSRADILVKRVSGEITYAVANGGSYGTAQYAIDVRLVALG